MVGPAGEARDEDDSREAEAGNLTPPKSLVSPSGYLN